MFREFSKLDKRYVHNNYAKNLRSSLLKIQERYDIFEKELKFLLWAYDLEFWTLDYAAEEYGLTRSKIGDRLVYPLMKHGWVYKHFDKLTPSQTREDHIFRDETKHNYRVRYAITQKARLLVRAFYRELEC